MITEKTFTITKVENGYIVTSSYSEPTIYAGMAASGWQTKSKQYICKDWDAVIETLKSMVV